MTRILFVLLLLAAASAAWADRHLLEVEAVAANVAVAPGDVRRDSLRLPALEYVFDLTTRCAEPFEPVSVSLTVADTRRTIDTEDLQAGGDAGEFRLTVPANQLSPVPVVGFCVADDARAGESTTGEMLLRATLSVGASLICASGDTQEITYASAPLDVRVRCEIAEEATESD